jgi:hypothetical protein
VGRRCSSARPRNDPWIAVVLHPPSRTPLRQDLVASITAELICEHLLPPIPQTPGTPAPPTLFIERAPRTRTLQPALPSLPDPACLHQALPHTRYLIEAHPNITPCSLRCARQARAATPNLSLPLLYLYTTCSPLTTDTRRTRTTAIPTPTETADV